MAAILPQSAAGAEPGHLVWLACQSVTRRCRVEGRKPVAFDAGINQATG